MPGSFRKLSSLPTRIGRRLLAVVEDFETGPAARWRRVYPDCYETVRALHRLAPAELRVLYDIGANTGSWTQTFAAFFPELAHVVLFEPADRCRAQLSSLTLPGVRLKHAAVALGRAAGEGTLQGGSESASLLAATTLQTQFFPGSINDTQQTVPITTLDAWAAHPEAPAPDIIKLDVQGGEGDVLVGGERTIARCRWLVIEVSTVALYDGQQRSGATLDWLEQRGWRVADIGYQWKNARHELLQFDAILTRANTA